MTDRLIIGLRPPDIQTNDIASVTHFIRVGRVDSNGALFPGAVKPFRYAIGAI